MSLLFNCLISLVLITAGVHLVIHWLFYLITCISTAFRSDRKSRRISTITLSAVIFTVLISYNSFLYYIVFSHVNWSNLFTSHPIATSLSESKYLLIIAIEPFVFIALTLFKCICAFIHLVRSHPDASIMMKLSVESQDRGRHVPDVYILMPVYNESMENLIQTLDGIVQSTYPKSKLRLIIACDDDRITPVFLSLVDLISPGEAGHSPARSIVLGSYRGLRIDLARFDHGGKRHAQMCAFLYLQQLLRDQIEKPLLMLLDSDIVLDRFAIAHFVYAMVDRPFCEAVTGLITIGSDGFLSYIQNCEYIDSQMLHRGTESLLGGVSCLPGALSMIRFESLRLVSREYFAQSPAIDSINFAKRSLGEDRYLTSLLLESDRRSHRVAFLPAARCLTPGCLTLLDLMKQRRRWFLGTISNEVAMLTSWKLWRHVPGLQMIQILLSIRNAPLFAYLVLFELIQSMSLNYVWLGLAAFGSVYIPIWIVVTYVTLSIHSSVKTIFIFPIYALLMPALSILFEFYGILSCRQRTWGGPRMQTISPPDHHHLDLTDDLSDIL